MAETSTINIVMKRVDVGWMVGSTAYPNVSINFMSLIIAVSNYIRCKIYL